MHNAEFSDPQICIGRSVRLAGLTVAYGPSVVLAKIDLWVEAGECVAVTGPSGSGKSTLLNCVTGTQLPSSGQIWFGDVDVAKLSRAERARLRRQQMGLMFQSPELLPELTVLENVALIQLFDGVARAEAHRSALAGLEAVGLAGHAGKRIDEISVGEAQRVALARALARPGVGLLVADEPSASLDVTNALAVTELITTRVRDLGVTALVATHDPLVAAACDRVVTLRDSSVAGATA